MKRESISLYPYSIQCLLGYYKKLKRNNLETDPLLTESQKARLIAWSAWWEEGEAHFAHWQMHEEDEKTAEAFAQILRQSDFAGGGDLSLGQCDRLCRLARRLSRHRNLIRRLSAEPTRRATFNAQSDATISPQLCVEERERLANKIRRKANFLPAIRSRI